MQLDPLIAILIGVLVIVLVIILFLPNIGLVARLKSGAKNTEKVFMEDILKYVYDCEYKGVKCTANSVTGNLDISSEIVIRILGKLRTLSLIEIDNREIELTEEGRTYALRIIRVHRIWERYLADETSVTEVEWHPRADLKEHSLSLNDANKLAAQLGNPVFDPHGDPIPTAKGEIPSHKGVSLNMMEPGQLVTILHVEDEPSTVYAQLVALGLHAHMKLKILEVSKDKVRFMTDKEEVVLAPLFAANITVVALEETYEFNEDTEILSDLKLGESAKIIALSPACRGQQRRRLMDMGVIPGSIIKSLMKSPTGEPTAYTVMGATIAFRKEQANQIYIKRIEKA